jgi:hypothetical protein
VPQPDDTPDVEPDGRGGRPPWWRRALTAVLRSIAKAIPGLRNRVQRNQPGTYRGLRDEWRGNRRSGMTRRQALRAT